MRIWFARLVAVLALAAVVAAVPVVIGSVHAHHTTSQADVASAVSQLSTVNLALSTRLVALRPGASPREAQAAVHTAADLARTLASRFKDHDDDLGVGMRTLVDAELAYLDAVGSSVANPKSVLLRKVVPNANALRAALASVPPGSPGDIRGYANFVAFSTARAGGAG